jgi:hypothetical protein
VRRLVAAVLGLLMLAACSKGNEPRPQSTTPVPAASPTASRSAHPAPLPSPSPSPAAVRPSPPEPTPARAPASAAPAPATSQAPSDDVRQPAPGDYVYDLTGSSTGLTGVSQPYPAGATQTVRVGPGVAAAGGTEYEVVQTSPQEPAVRTTVRSRWEPGLVRLVSTVIQLSGLANYPCTYNPSPTVFHIPPVAETLPAQSFAGDCSGTLDVTISGPETVTAAGRSWRTWKVHSRSTFAMGVGLTGTIDTTAWLAPELGEPVKGETAIDAQLLATRLSARQSTVLRSHP